MQAHPTYTITSITDILNQRGTFCCWDAYADYFKTAYPGLKVVGYGTKYVNGTSVPKAVQMQADLRSGKCTGILSETEGDLHSPTAHNCDLARVGEVIAVQLESFVARPDNLCTIQAIDNALTRLELAGELGPLTDAIYPTFSCSSSSSNVNNSQLEVGDMLGLFMINVIAMVIALGIRATRYALLQKESTELEPENTTVVELQTASDLKQCVEEWEKLMDQQRALHARMAPLVNQADGDSEDEVPTMHNDEPKAVGIGVLGRAQALRNRL